MARAAGGVAGRGDRCVGRHPDARRSVPHAAIAVHAASSSASSASAAAVVDDVDRRRAVQAHVLPELVDAVTGAAARRGALCLRLRVGNALALVIVGARCVAGVARATVRTTRACAPAEPSTRGGARARATRKKRHARHQDDAQESRSLSHTKTVRRGRCGGCCEFVAVLQASGRGAASGSATVTARPPSVDRA